MEPWLPEMAAAIATQIRAGKVTDKQSLQQAKQREAKRLGAERMPQDPEFLPLLPPEDAASWGFLLRKKPMRSQSGVAIVAVMSSPAGCPHGKCIYCPGGPDVDAPQSYTGFEPSTMRAKRYAYDPYRIVRARLSGLERNGHTVDKVEVVVQGGTFPAREQAYQDWFIHGIYAACNAGPSEEDTDSGSTVEEWETWSEEERRERLQQVMRDNESTRCRVIGLTVETKPDWCFEPHIDAMLRQGATRIELGIQTLSDEVTKLTHRGHDVDDARRAMRAARDAGYKVCVHMMPGLPRPAGERGTRPTQVREDLQVPGLPRPAGEQSGTLPAIHMAGNGKAHFMVDAEADIEDIRMLFEDPDFRPDMLKIYPTLIVKEGETTLKRWWKEGRFEPLDTAGAVNIVAESLRHVQEYCRIQRIDRDIPTTHVLAGVMNSNLRQLAEAEALERGVRLRDIRAREIGTRQREGADVQQDRMVIVRRDYEASGGQESFLSFEDPEADALAGFIRIRRVGTPHRPELEGAAVVRELKVYGAAQGLGEHDPAAWQHRGYGARLLAAAEEVAAQDWGVTKVAVLAGPGVKEYYRRHGYMDLGPYVAKVFP